MLLPIEHLVLLCLGFFIVAALYASVGFGGGSSYLALLSLTVIGFFGIRSLALVCNLMVVSTSTFLYFKNRHANLKDFLPFVVASVPLAFIGASFRLKEEVFFIILGGALVVSSIALAWQTFHTASKKDFSRRYPKWVSYGLGASIGLLSGLVGIGGGIFLAPVLNHLRWASSLKIAALASFFILVNSLSSLAGLAAAETLALPFVETVALMATVFLGGQLGIRIGLKKMTPRAIKMVTALLVFIVGIRVLLKNGLGVF